MQKLLDVLMPKFHFCWDKYLLHSPGFSPQAQSTQSKQSSESKITLQASAVTAVEGR